MKYLFTTHATMKQHNNRKWWIDRDIIRDKYITAENLPEALKKYAEAVEKSEYITISKNALKNKSAMYVDDKDGSAKQVGYVITASTEFDDDGRGWVKQFIDLWVNVARVVDCFDEAAA